MAVRIPIPVAFPASEMSISFNGRIWRLRFRWNTRDQSWSMDVLDAERTPVLLGVKVVSDWLLLRRYAQDELLEVDIVSVDTSGQAEEPGRDDLGARVMVLFTTKDEVLAALQ